MLLSTFGLLFLSEYYTILTERDLEVQSDRRHNCFKLIFRTKELGFNINLRATNNKPNIIDIEASGFGPDSYPIEIGVIRSDGARYCKLIKPFSDWSHWDKEAEIMHGISRELLASVGLSGVQVCLDLNEFIGAQTTYSDCWVVDSPWLNKLFDRAQIELSFRISSIEMILKESQYAAWDQIKLNIASEFNIQRHRASNDALIIQKTFEATLHRDLRHDLHKNLHNK